MVGSTIDVVLDLLKVFYFFSCFHCYLLSAVVSKHCFRFGETTFESFEQLEHKKRKLVISCYFFLSFALLSDVSALLIDVLDSGHQLSSVSSGPSSKNLKEVYVFEVSFVELLSVNEGTIIVY